MPQMNGIEFLAAVRQRWPETIRIVLSGYAETGVVVAAINDGQIYKFIPKPWNDDELRVTVANAVSLYFLHEKNAELTEELQQSVTELQILNKNLEQAVSERTAEILKKNERLEWDQAILGALPFGVLCLDGRGSIIQCNDTAAALLGSGIGALLDSPAEKVLPAVITGLLGRWQSTEPVKERIAFSDRILDVLILQVKTRTDEPGAALVLTPCEGNLNERAAEYNSFRR